MSDDRITEVLNAMLSVPGGNDVRDTVDRFLAMHDAAVAADEKRKRLDAMMVKPPPRPTPESIEFAALRRLVNAIHDYHLVRSIEANKPLGRALVDAIAYAQTVVDGTAIKPRASVEREPSAAATERAPQKLPDGWIDLRSLTPTAPGVVVTEDGFHSMRVMGLAAITLWETLCWYADGGNHIGMPSKYEDDRGRRATAAIAVVGRPMIDTRS